MLDEREGHNIYVMLQEWKIIVPSHPGMKGEIFGSLTKKVRTLVTKVLILKMLSAKNAYFAKKA